MTMELGDTSFNPSISGAMLYVITTLVFAFVPPSSLGVRLLALGLLVCLQAHVISTARFYMRPSWSAILAGHASFVVLHYVDMGLLRRYECEKVMPGNDSKRDNRSLLHRLYCGWLLMSSIRKIDTPLETKNVPRFPHDTPPDRRVFLVTQARRFVFCFLAADLIFSLRIMSSPSSASVLPPPDAPPLRRFAQMSPIVLAQGVTTYTLVLGMYSVWAFMAVALGLSEPRAWRPIIGSFGDVFTLRGLWGSFWHQLGRDLWSRPASAIVHDLLGFPRGSMWLPMQLKMVIVFALSGAVHLGCDMALGMSWRDSRAMHFFVLQAFGIMLESYVSLLLGRKDVVGLPKDWSGPQKMLGFVWVFFWMFWTASMWVRPMVEIVQQRTSGLGDSIVPFSVLQPAANLLLHRSF